MPQHVGYAYAWVMQGCVFKSWSDLTGISHVIYKFSKATNGYWKFNCVCVSSVFILPQWFSSVEWAPTSGDVPSERLAAETRHRLLEPLLCSQTGQTNKQEKKTSLISNIEDMAPCITSSNNNRKNVDIKPRFFYYTCTYLKQKDVFYLIAWSLFLWFLHTTSKRTIHWKSTHASWLSEDIHDSTFCGYTQNIKIQKQIQKI